jgi:uncharacterized protein YhfF
MTVLISLYMTAAAVVSPTECDRLAAHPEDPQRVTPGVSQDQIDYPVALAACERAVTAEPANARVRYQLARLLFYTNQNQRAVEEMKRSADAGHVQAQYIFGTFVARGRPFAPTDICLAERYWRESAAAGRQAARVQYLRFTLKGKFEACSTVASDAELQSFVDAAGKDAKGLYEQVLAEDFREALAQRPVAAVRAAWSRCAAERGLEVNQPIRARRFGDTEPMTTQLNGLILAGEKTITAGSPWLAEADASRRAFEGGYSVMTDAAGAPRAVLRTTMVKTLPFDQVTDEYSRHEGPTVRSLDAWRRVHQAFFERTLKPLGKTWSSGMPVTLERFEVVCRI